MNTGLAIFLIIISIFLSIRTFNKCIGQYLLAKANKLKEQQMNVENKEENENRNHYEPTKRDCEIKKITKDELGKILSTDMEEYPCCEIDKDFEILWNNKFIRKLKYVYDEKEMIKDHHIDIDELHNTAHQHIIPDEPKEFEVVCYINDILKDYEDADELEIEKSKMIEMSEKAFKNEDYIANFIIGVALDRLDEAFFNTNQESFDGLVNDIKIIEICIHVEDFFADPNRIWFEISYTDPEGLWISYLAEDPDSVYYDIEQEEMDI